MKWITCVLIGALGIMLMVPLASGQTDDLEIINFDLTGENFAEISLTMDPDDVSVLFQVRAADSEDFIYLTEIYSVDNDEPLYFIDEEDSVFRFAFSPYAEDIGGELGVYLPVHPDAPLDAGEYIFVFETDGSEITELNAIVRSGNVDAQQSLDFNLWVLTDELASADDQSAFEQTIRNSMNTMLNPHDLSVGSIRFIDASDADYDAYAYPQISEDESYSLQDVCLAMGAAVGYDRAVNVAIVEGFDESGEGGTAGIANMSGSGGIILSESAFSCVVVSYEAYGTDFDAQAANILHETGHFLSLAHTTESDGEVFDTFDDTPACDYASYDTNDDGFVDDFECDRAGGASNLMFWSGEPEFAPYIFTASQAWVLRRHPLFYPSN